MSSRAKTPKYWKWGFKGWAVLILIAVIAGGIMNTLLYLSHAVDLFSLLLSFEIAITIAIIGLFAFLHNYGWGDEASSDLPPRIKKATFAIPRVLFTMFMFFLFGGLSMFVSNFFAYVLTISKDSYTFGIIYFALIFSFAALGGYIGFKITYANWFRRYLMKELPLDASEDAHS